MYSYVSTVEAAANNSIPTPVLDAASENIEIKKNIFRKRGKVTIASIDKAGHLGRKTGKRFYEYNK